MASGSRFVGRSTVRIPLAGECIHHWLLPEANGTPTLTARCRKCGAERAMRVSCDESLFWPNSGRARHPLSG